MFSKLRTLTVACSVALLAVSTVAMACPGDEQVVVAKSQPVAESTAVLQVVDITPKQCSKSRRASSVAVASKTKKAAGCAKSAATQETLALLAKAVAAMPNDGSRADIIAAYRTLATANGNLVCEKQAASVKAIAFASGCRAAKAKAKATQVANVTTACDPANCSAACLAALKAGKTKATKVAAGQSACRAAQRAKQVKQVKQDRYVAFGCSKTDKLARAAANGYLQIMRELKTYSGADGCAASCASKLLAQVLADQSAQANATVDVPVVETVANIETPVNLGAVSDVKTTKKRWQCTAGRK